MSRTAAEAFDEWQRRYIEEPDRFASEFETVREFVRQGGLTGNETSYGEDCAAYLEKLMKGEELHVYEDDYYVVSAYSEKDAEAVLMGHLGTSSYGGPGFKQLGDEAMLWVRGRGEKRTCSIWVQETGRAFIAQIGGLQ